MVISAITSTPDFLTCVGLGQSRVVLVATTCGFCGQELVGRLSLLSFHLVNPSSFPAIHRVTPLASYLPVKIPGTTYPRKASLVCDTSSHLTLDPDSPAVLDTVKVIQYDDCALDPPFIGPKAFFFRHTFRPNIKHVTVSLLYRSICVLCC